MLQEAVEYVARRSPEAAEALRVRLVQAPRVLATSPKLGRRVPEFGVDSLRELIVAPYRLVYVYKDDRDTCSIVALYHGKQDLTRLPRPNGADEP